MALPISPTNGQTATLNGITYVYNETNNAWKRQTLTDLSIIGNVTAGNLILSGDNSRINSALVYDLDNIYPDGRTNSFSLRYNQSLVTVTNPWNLLVTINGYTQPAFIENTDTVWQGLALTAESGYTISNGNIKFSDPPPAGTIIKIKTQIGSSNSTTKIYPFKPLDILLGL